MTNIFTTIAYRIKHKLPLSEKEKAFAELYLDLSDPEQPKLRSIQIEKLKPIPENKNN